MTRILPIYADHNQDNQEISIIGELWVRITEQADYADLLIILMIIPRNNDNLGNLRSLVQRQNTDYTGLADYADSSGTNLEINIISLFCDAHKSIGSIGKIGYIDCRPCGTNANDVSYFSYSSD